MALPRYGDSQLAAATFDDFVKQRTARARQRAEKFNCEETLATWRRELEVLYDAMEGFLKSYIDSLPLAR